MDRAMNDEQRYKKKKVIKKKKKKPGPERGMKRQLHLDTLMNVRDSHQLAGLSPTYQFTLPLSIFQHEFMDLLQAIDDSRRRYINIRE